MAHFLLLVIGDHAEDQLAIYDMGLPVQPHKQYLSQAELYRIEPDGRDELGFYILSRDNPRGKWDWNIMGGRWCGYLKLKHGAYGELGKRGAGIADDDPLKYGDRSADCALYGDIDWYGMRQHERAIAQQIWDNAPSDFRWMWGIEPDMTEDEFIDQRSHPGPFAILDDSEWYQRGEIGWWGIMLDATPVSEWHAVCDKLMPRSPDTLITIVDCHIASQ